MIAPPPSVNGSAERRIRIRAVHDGRVLIDGEGRNLPVVLRKNEYMSIEGVNACCSRLDVVFLSRTRAISLNRVVAWDAAVDQNSMVFSIAYGSDTLLEDTAGFGSGRKIYSYFQTNGPATIRRAWGEWNRSINKGPKMTFSLIYNSRNLTVENAIGTWRNLMPERYILFNNGKPFVAGVWSEYNHRKITCGVGELQPDGTCLVTDRRIDQMYAVLTADAFSRGQPNRRANSRYLGSLAYVLSGVEAGALPRLVFSTQVESVTLENVVALWPEGTSGKDAILLGNCTYAAPEVPCSSTDWALNARSLTAFRGRLRVASPKQWDVRDGVEAASPAALYGSSGASVFLPGEKGGASLCFQYHDGVLTGMPLWPWPMNERIKEAMVQAGREPVDVTRTIERLFGPIPPACRSERPPSPSPTSSSR